MYKRKLEELFNNHKIRAKVVSCEVNEPYLIFDIETYDKASKIEKLGTEIALKLQAIEKPITYPVLHQGIIRIEVLTAPPQTVLWRDIQDNSTTLPLILGKLRDGSDLVPDLSTMPHLLVGGSTGSGKSILLHSIINGLLRRDNIRFVLIDTKRVEFSFYSEISRLYAPIIQNVDSAIKVLNDLVEEMEQRYVKLRKAGCRDISVYNKKMSYIVVVIDELADLMLADKRTIQDLICRLAQKSRACGIHIVAATQRPSRDVISGLILNNFPARISCKMSSAIDSRVLLGQSGAEKLLGKGDAIIDSPLTGFRRFKGAYLSEMEINSAVLLNTSIWRKLWFGKTNGESQVGMLRI